MNWFANATDKWTFKQKYDNEKKLTSFNVKYFKMIMYMCFLGI